MIFGLSEVELKIIIDEIKAHLGQSKNPKLYIFGSRVKGNYRKYSDVDLLLIADSYDETELCKIDFENLDISYKIDFVILPKLFKVYKEEVFTHMQEIHF